MSSPASSPRSSAAQRRKDIETARQQMLELREEMVAIPDSLQSLLDAAHPNFRESARNLVHYLHMRQQDLRPLQMRLSALGLSSLGRAESHVLATIDAVLEVLHELGGQRWEPGEHLPTVYDFAHGQHLLEQHANALLGPAEPGRHVRIMVTMPSEAADDPRLIHDLLAQGMDCMRINCAHDDAATWARMIKHLRRAERALGNTCKVVMDLGGPKLRTGPLEPGPAVLRLRARRDALGQPCQPARIWLHAEDAAPAAPPEDADGCVPVPAVWLGSLRSGDRIRLTDARGKRRSMEVVQTGKTGCWAEAERTLYVAPGTLLRRIPATGKSTPDGPPHDAAVGALPATPSALLLRAGDLLRVTRDQQPGQPATLDANGKVLSPASIGCTLPEVFDDVRAGEPIWFDDGKIGGVVEQMESDHALVRITRAGLDGEKLRADKGINLPDSDLHIPALTAQDLIDLEFIAANADVVELSFANTADDVEQLEAELRRLGRPDLAIVLKIETRRGFENLPQMLLSAMQGPCCGIMIARGDLAVESGFERLAELQEEILWICEAAHVPVIWATQVLESLAKEGLPSRAEVTDAAMGHRAECVMLNKGPHVREAVRVLDDILCRMRSHQTKKRTLLRELRLAHGLYDIAPSEGKQGKHGKKSGKHKKH